MNKNNDTVCKDCLSDCIQDTLFLLSETLNALSKPEFDNKSKILTNCNLLYKYADKMQTLIQMF